MTNIIPWRSLLALVALACAAHILLGCAATLATARSTVDMAGRTYAEIEPSVVHAYEGEQLACLDKPAPPEPCVAAVRSRWAPVKARVVEFYRALLTARSAVSVAEAGAAAGRKPDAGAILKVVLVAIDAAETVRAAIAAMGAP